jgi:hypothetical protein
MKRAWKRELARERGEASAREGASSGVFPEEWEAVQGAVFFTQEG